VPLNKDSAPDVDSYISLRGKGASPSKPEVVKPCLPSNCITNLCKSVLHSYRGLLNLNSPARKSTVWSKLEEADPEERGRVRDERDEIIRPIRK